LAVTNVLWKNRFSGIIFRANDRSLSVGWRSAERGHWVSSEPTVFVVDDDTIARQAMVKLLGAIFARVEGYASASEFLAAYDREQPGCLVAEVVLPGMSGLELHRRLSAARDGQPALPVIFVTRHASVPIAVEAMQAGAVHFLEKPAREQDIWNSVRKALDIDRENRDRAARRAQMEKRLATLSHGEREVLDRILTGKFNKQIASELSLSIRTIEDRRARVMKKLEVTSLVELVQGMLNR
jgi:FixJ family two-component response regulator